jgi:hypothetical protein
MTLLHAEPTFQPFHFRMGTFGAWIACHNLLDCILNSAFLIVKVDQYA